LGHTNTYTHTHTHTNVTKSVLLKKPASWADVDLDEFLERTASGDWFRRDSSRAGDKRQPARCSRKTHAYATVQRLLCHGNYCKIILSTGARAFFAESMHAFRQVSWAPCTCMCLR